MTKYYYRKNRKGKGKLYLRALGIASLFFGVILFLYFFFPVVSYHVFLSQASLQNTIESPLPKYLVAKEGTLKSLIVHGISSLTTDYIDARNWYPDVPSDVKKIKTESYTLSIPRLKIENAQVSTTDYNLSLHLIQYFGTSAPGERGTSVIFGHSTLPAWFDPKNYKTIFATLHTLQVGDEIYVQVEGVTYRYKIFSITITASSDTNMFSQSYDNSYITLVTCTPPGTTWKRLIIRASLDKLI